MAGAVIFALIPTQVRDVGGAAVGPRAFPYFLAGLLMVCSLLLVLQSVSAQKSRTATEPSGGSAGNTQEKPKEIGPSGVGYALMIFALLALYVLSMQVVGYVIASLVFLPLMLYLLGVRKKLLYLLIVPIVLTVYGVFSMLLYVQLP